PGCYLTDHDHGVDPSLAPLAQPMVGAPTRLGDEVWLGANVVVLKGVSIGDRAVVGAGSVVTKDIPPDAVAVGVPARVVRVRGVTNNDCKDQDGNNKDHVAQMLNDNVTCQGKQY